MRASRTPGRRALGGGCCVLRSWSGQGVQPFGVSGGQYLGDRAAGVVRDQVDIGQAERLAAVGEQAGQGPAARNPGRRRRESGRAAGGRLPRTGVRRRAARSRAATGSCWCPRRGQSARGGRRQAKARFQRHGKWHPCSFGNKEKFNRSERAWVLWPPTGTDGASSGRRSPSFSRRPGSPGPSPGRISQAAPAQVLERWAAPEPAAVVDAVDDQPGREQQRVRDRRVVWSLYSWMAKSFWILRPTWDRTSTGRSPERGTRRSRGCCQSRSGSKPRSSGRMNPGGIQFGHGDHGGCSSCSPPAR